jgi:DivIVA domain-containing protein
MNISSKDIRKRDFGKSFRGYEPAEVDAFLEAVGNQFDKILTENKNLNDKIKSLQTDVELYRENEVNLQKAIIKSQDLGEEIVQNARKKGELIIREAELTANKLHHNLEGEILNKKQDLEEYKLKNDKIMGDVKNFLLEKLNELEDFIRTKKILKMELTNFSDLRSDTSDDDEEEKEAPKQDEPKKNMKKISLSSFTESEDKKSFDDNFEEKR